jgi:hypothetical protein
MSGAAHLLLPYAVMSWEGKFTFYLLTVLFVLIATPATVFEVLAKHFVS